MEYLMCRGPHWKDRSQAANGSALPSAVYDWISQTLFMAVPKAILELGAAAAALSVVLLY